MRAGAVEAPERVLLGFDTSRPVGSIAVTRGGRLLGARLLPERAEHASRLLPAIDAVMREAGVVRADLDGVVAGAGPGSFTGVRVAAATAKGLVRALGVPLWAVSSLAGAALVEGRAERVRYTLFDARGDRVYAACYDVGPDGISELVAPHAATVQEVLAGGVPGDATFVGDGALRHRDPIERAGFAVAEPSGRPLVEGLLDYLRRRPDFRPVDDVGAWQPAYVRAWRTLSA